MHTEGSSTPTTIYSSKVPKCRFVFDSTILLVLIVAVVCITVGLDVELLGKHFIDRRSIFALSMTVAEMIGLLFILDLFLWYWFGHEIITITGNELVVENRHRIIGKVRSIALNEIDVIEIDNQDQLHLFSAVSRLRYMLHRGNLILYNSNGTRMRLCMSTDSVVLNSVSDTIRNAIKLKRHYRHEPDGNKRLSLSKCKTIRMEQQIVLNEHSRQEEPLMHTSRNNTSLMTKCIVVFAVLFVMELPAVAQERMHPIPFANLQKSNFETKLSRGFNVEEACKFVYLVEPSFTTEYCMTYDAKRKSLVLIKAKDKIGYYVWGEKKGKNRTKTYRLPVEDAYVDSLQSMFCTIIKSASPDYGRYGLDGTSYLFYLPSDMKNVVDVWEPLEESNCGRVVSVMERLCEAVEKNDEEMIEQLREEIIELAAVFRALPEVYYNRPKPNDSE